MEQNRQQRELAHSFSDLRPRSGCFPTGDQPGQAKRPLQRVLQVMVARIDRLIIAKLPGKTGLHPTERLRHKIAPPGWKELPINAINLLLHRARHLRIHLGKHSAKTIFGPPVLPAEVRSREGGGAHLTFLAAVPLVKTIPKGRLSSLPEISFVVRDATDRPTQLAGRSDSVRVFGSCKRYFGSSTSIAASFFTSAKKSGILLCNPC